jgi:hypothetical protein
MVAFCLGERNPYACVKKESEREKYLIEFGKWIFPC